MPPRSATAARSCDGTGASWCLPRHERNATVERSAVAAERVRIPDQVEMVPGECPQLLGSSAREQGQHDVSGKRARLRGPHEPLGLSKSQRLRRATSSATWRGAEHGHVAPDQVASFCPADHAAQDREDPAQGPVLSVCSLPCSRRSMSCTFKSASFLFPPQEGCGFRPGTGRS